MKLKYVAKVAVINDRQEVLLLRRSQTDDRRPGEWDFPGGGVEPGEHMDEAASRELFEEAGIAVAPGNLITAYLASEFYEPGNEVVHRALYICHVSSDAVTLSFEHDAVQWTPVKQALIDFPHPFYGTGLAFALEHDLLH